MAVHANRGREDHGARAAAAAVPAELRPSPSRRATGRRRPRSSGPVTWRWWPARRCAGGMVLFRQTNEMYHLTGVEVPHAYLLIDGDTGASTLYLAHNDAGHARSSGDYLNADDVEVAARLTGFERVQPVEQLARDLARYALRPIPPRAAHAGGARRRGGRQPRLAARRDRLGGRRPVGVDVDRRVAIRHGGCAATFPSLEVGDLTPILDRLREVKDDVEIELLRRAGALTADAMTEAMRCTAPGVHEYELAAVANFVFLAGGARGEGYRAIVGGGKNAWFGHYGRLADPLRDGDLVLMDHAADYAYYTSDIGRMWPVNGTFTTAQRTLYGFIVDYHRRLLARIGPGVDSWELMAEVREEMAPVVERTEWAAPHHRAGGAGRPRVHRPPVAPGRHGGARRRRLPLAPARAGCRHGDRPDDLDPRGAPVRALRGHRGRHRRRVRGADIGGAAGLRRDRSGDGRGRTARPVVRRARTPASSGPGALVTPRAGLLNADGTLDDDGGRPVARAPGDASQLPGRRGRGAARRARRPAR